MSHVSQTSFTYLVLLERVDALDAHVLQWQNLPQT